MLVLFQRDRCKCVTTFSIAGFRIEFDIQFVKNSSKTAISPAARALAFASVFAIDAIDRDRARMRTSMRSRKIDFEIELHANICEGESRTRMHPR